MSLADCLKDGSYLPEGRYICTIKKLRFFDYHSGSKGVEVTCANADQTTIISFNFHKKARWRLARFALAAGLTEAQLRGINEETGQGLDLIVGQQVGIVVAKNEKGYHEGIEWFMPSESSTGLPPFPPDPDEQGEPEPSTEAQGNDDLPF